MRRILPIALLALGCQPTTVEYTPWTREQGTVTEKAYVPSSRYPCAKLNADLELEPGWCDRAEQYNVAIKCQHYENHVDSKDLFDIVKKNQEITIRFRERTTKTYEGKEGTEPIKTEKTMEHDFLPLERQ